VVQADATAPPFLPGVFDVAVAVNVLDHLADPTVAIGEAHRVLAPGGTLVAATASRHDSPEQMLRSLSSMLCCGPGRGDW
jgi:SAM-dependent methyltransferase